MVTCGCPNAAGVAGNAGAELALEAALDGDAAALDDGPAALLSLEQPAMPATIAAAPTAINSSTPGHRVSLLLDLVAHTVDKRLRLFPGR